MSESNRRSPKRKRNSYVKVNLPSYVRENFIPDLLSALPAEEDSFKAHYLRSNLLSKFCPKDNPDFSAQERRDAAIDKWRRSEQRNAATNRRLLLADETDHFGWTTWPRFRTRVRRIVARILGPVAYPHILQGAGHTNGSSTRVPRSETAAIEKLEGEAHVSASAVTHWLAFADGCPRLLGQTLYLRESSGLSTVPKRRDIDRVVCKEPEINVALQRSVGFHIRHRLKQIVGVDLNDQRHNQRLAKEAVRLGLATIDLSSASDTISRQLVFELLPWDWYSLLDDLRVKSTLIPIYDPKGKKIGEHEHSFEMFSSMGNGFTFELESLLFYALTRAVMMFSGCKGIVSVYGDDIVAPSKIVPRLIRMFHFVGFKTNSDKTFWRGRFRESCGKHYHWERDVSPFFVRREVSHLADLINLLNQLLDWDGRDYGFFHTPELAAFHRKYSAFVPTFLWGGVSTEENDRLVTGHAPRKRLVLEPKESSFNEDAGLTHWFMLRENPDRRKEAPVKIEPATGDRFKAKRASRGWLTTWRPYLIM